MSGNFFQHSAVGNAFVLYFIALVVFGKKLFAALTIKSERIKCCFDFHFRKLMKLWIFNRSLRGLRFLDL